MMPVTEYQKETLKNLRRMEKDTETHRKGCACHTCIYKRDIQSRPEIKSINKYTRNGVI